MSLQSFALDLLYSDHNFIFIFFLSIVYWVGINLLIVTTNHKKKNLTTSDITIVCFSWYTIIENKESSILFSPPGIIDKDLLWKTKKNYYYKYIHHNNYESFELLHKIWFDFWIKLMATWEAWLVLKKEMPHNIISKVFSCKLIVGTLVNYQACLQKRKKARYILCTDSFHKNHQINIIDSPFSKLVKWIIQKSK